jgi:hypothetical protein
VRCGRVATRQGQAHLETAEAALRVGLGRNDHHNTGVEDGVEQALGELVAIVNGECVEEGQIAKSCGQGLGVGSAGAAGIGDEDGRRHPVEPRMLSLVPIGAGSSRQA